MSRPTLAAFLLLPLAAPAAGPEVVPIQERDGSRFVALPSARTRTVPRTVTTDDDGVPVTQTVLETVSETVQVNVALDPAAGDFFDLNGDRIDPKKLPDVLTKGAALAVVPAARPLDPAALKGPGNVVAQFVRKRDVGQPSASALAAARVKVKDGTATVGREVIKYRSVKRKGVRRVQGEKDVPYEYTEVVAETVTDPVPLDDAARYFTREGKALTPKEAAGRLKDNDRVILTSDGRMPAVDGLNRFPDAVLVVAFKAPPPPPAPPAGVRPPGPAAAPAAPPAAKPPAGDDPFVTEVVLEGGGVVVRRPETVHEQVMMQQARATPDGKTVTVTVPVLVPVTREVKLTLDPKALAVQTPDGKGVAAADWQKVLKEKTLVIVSPAGKPVPAEFVKANRGAVLILVVEPKR